jgi:hypothetical protein
MILALAQFMYNISVKDAERMSPNLTLKKENQRMAKASTGYIEKERCGDT